MKMLGIFRLLLINLIVVLVVSCRPTFNSFSKVNTPKQLSYPASEFYDSLVIVENEMVVLIDGGEFDDLQYYAKEGEAEYQRFNFPEDHRCSSTRYYAYETLPDGRLQVWKHCFTENGTITYLMAYDWLAQKLNDVSGPLPLGSSGASWNPDQTRAIAYLDSKFASKTLFWISNGGYSPLDLNIVDGNHSWNLKDDFPDFNADDTGKTGTTGRAAWSPDGKQIAFFASADAIGKTGFERFNVEYKLYLMSPETLHYEVVADGIFSPFLLSWSPDSTHLAFIGDYGILKEKGIWLYSVKTNIVAQVSKGRFQSIVWSTDGEDLVAIQCDSIDLCDKVLKYDVTNLVYDE